MAAFARVGRLDSREMVKNSREGKTKETYPTGA